MKLAGALAWVLAAILLAGCGSRPSAPESPAATPAKATLPDGEEGGRLPAFRLRDVNGREVSSDEFRGKVLLVDYWATWCKPCEVEMPGFEQLREQYEARGFAVVGIAMDTNPNDVAKFARQHRIRYPLLMGTPEVQERFGILGIPTTMLVDRSGIVRKKVIGFEDKEAFESVLRGLLNHQTAGEKLTR